MVHRLGGRGCKHRRPAESAKIADLVAHASSAAGIKAGSGQEVVTKQALELRGGAGYFYGKTEEGISELLENP